MKNRFKIILLLFSFFHCALADDDDKVLTFGIVPQQSAKKLAITWTPILKEVSKKSGYTIRFKTAKDIPTFEKRVATGDFDLAYMNPYHYTVFHEKPGYMAFAKRKNKKIHGIIVVAKSNPIKNVQELNDQTLAFPSPAAFAASIITRSYLKQKGLNITPKYVSSHDSVYRNVEKGLVAAGGGIVRTLKGLDPKIRNNLKIFWKSPGYTPHAFAYHPKLAKEAIRKVEKAFIGLNDTEKGRTLLKRIKFPGIVKAQNEDWDDVRKLNIQELKKSTKKK